MKITAVSKQSPGGLPPCLLSAQEAIHLPEVREMLRRLADYRLGIYMPHMFDRYLPVGWVWRAGAPATSAVCEMVREEQAGNAARYDKHKMDRGN